MGSGPPSQDNTTTAPRAAPRAAHRTYSRAAAPRAARCRTAAAGTAPPLSAPRRAARRAAGTNAASSAGPSPPKPSSSSRAAPWRAAFPPPQPNRAAHRPRRTFKKPRAAPTAVPQPACAAAAPGSHQAALCCVWRKQLRISGAGRRLNGEGGGVGFRGGGNKQARHGEVCSAF